MNIKKWKNPWLFINFYAAVEAEKRIIFRPKQDPLSKNNVHCLESIFQHIASAKGLNTGNFSSQSCLFLLHSYIYTFSVDHLSPMTPISLKILANYFNFSISRSVGMKRNMSHSICCITRVTSCFIPKPSFW